MSRAALPVLRAPRLTLRPLKPSDAPAIVAGVGNYDVSRWLSVVPYPYTRADADWFLDRTIKNGKSVWAICDGDGLQGIVGIEDELGYWLARPVWGRGYGFEAARAVTEHWFGDLKAGDLTSGYFTGNARSGAVLRAIGFEPVGKGTRHARALSQDVEAVKMLMTRARWQKRQDFTLYTPRLSLRPIAERDAQDLAALTVSEVTRNLSRVKTGMSTAEVLADLPRRTWRGYPGFTLVIEYQSAVVGTVGFGGTMLSIGYFLSPSHWGKGLMTEALSAFLPELFERFPVNLIAADHFEDNSASGRILRKFGFVETGRGTGTSKGRLEPAPVITYAVTRQTLKVPV